MILPSIHLNGSSADTLTEDYFTAALAVADAIRAVEHAAPNARDYYPQGNQALTAALADHFARIRALAAVRDDMNKLAEHCSAFVK